MGLGTPGFPLFQLVSESRHSVLIMMACKKAFKDLGHFLNDVAISLRCAQTLLTPVVFAVMQHTQGKNAF